MSRSFTNPHRYSDAPHSRKEWRTRNNSSLRVSIRQWINSADYDGTPVPSIREYGDIWWQAENKNRYRSHHHTAYQKQNRKFDEFSEWNYCLFCTPEFYRLITKKG